MTQFQKFLLMIEAVGEDATEEQVERLVSWAVRNLPRSQWSDACANASEISDFYTSMRERMSECGVY